ncbi:MAG: sulfotransferase domain-containing protein [Synechococcaceae cyanobacterium]|jgi:hypothetical protein
MDTFFANREDMIDIIVTGYPKSGNTWVTRLVADLAGCPVVGFINSDHDEIACEGFDRKSHFQCFKSHHQLDELLNIKSNTKKVIYVIRDPRDICLSGANYFRIERWPLLGRLFRRMPGGDSIYLWFHKLLPCTPNYRFKRMAQAVIYGSWEVHYWVRVSWATHYKPYLEKQYFFVKYEDLISDPELECKRIIRFLGIERDDSQIKAAIERQSFDNKKQEFISKGQLAKANFMRAGRGQQWKQKLSKDQKKMFRNALANELNQLGYPVNDSDV